MFYFVIFFDLELFSFNNVMNSEEICEPPFDKSCVLHEIYQRGQNSCFVQCMRFILNQMACTMRKHNYIDLMKTV